MQSTFIFCPLLSYTTTVGLSVIKLCRFALYIFFASMLIVQPSLAAEDRWYQAEVIIAERLTGAADKEQHPTSLAAPVPASQQLKDYPSIGTQAYTRLPESNHRLIGIKRHLQSSAEYKILFHEAWPLGIGKQKPVIWIRVNGGTEHYGHHQLEGAIGVSMGRFLHLHTQLHLNRFVTNSTSADNIASAFISFPYQQAQVSQRFSMQQQRKMRSKELHYLDHPKLILLVRFDPYSPQVGPVPKPESKPAISHDQPPQGAIASPISEAISVPLEN
ncbi:MAG: CsiV family protein, partial [Gammaproteobacteria bacterium]|nr:CsiV family protein [Gammaproteobacteria bacterium]